MLLANPVDTNRIRINAEHDDIKEKLRSSSSPGLFETISRVKPSIIHFSGHGRETKKMLLEDEEGNSFELKASQFVSLLKAKPIQDNLKLIVFNACYMETFAEKSLEEVACVIGTEDAIPDETARAFSKNFYSDLANGCSVKEAFDRSISLAEIKKLPKTDVPILLGNGEVRFTVEETEGQITPPKKEEGKTVIQNADKIYNIDKIDHAEFN
jgi:hypothetical protein